MRLVLLLTLVALLFSATLALKSLRSDDWYTQKYNKNWISEVKD